MKRPILAFFSIVFLCVISCGELGSSYEQITSFKTTKQRINNLNKSMKEVKQSEEKAALSREENDYLEYEYPIREDESYVMSYRFDDAGCFEIGLDTYFNKQKEAQNVIDGIIKAINSEGSYGEPEIDNDIYRWEASDNAVRIELDCQNVERGMISLTIFATE
jgi:hypothetical protein